MGGVKYDLENLLEEIMKKVIFTACVVLIMAMFVGCTSISPITATSNELGSKVGTSTASFILGFPVSTDYSIQAAAKEGGITKISTVDLKTFNYLGIWSGCTTIVTGE